MILKGNIVDLRPMLIEDIPMITKWFIDNELPVYYIGTVLGSIEEVKQFFENSLKNPAKRKDFVVIKKATDTPVGMVSLENINWIHRSASYVVFFGEHGDRKREYAWESHVLCFDYGFDILNLHRIEMRMYAANRPILRTLEDWIEFSHGDEFDPIYIHEGTLTEAAFFCGDYTDVELYAVLQEGYKSMQNRFHSVLKSKKHPAR